MKQIKRNEITREQVQKALACETAEELMALAASEGYEMTKDQAEAFIAELSDFELDRGDLKKAAGGGDYWCWHGQCTDNCEKAAGIK